jgi:4-amino-4-deoxy-L-arabinose transferase-like glycosyltransferase
MAAMETQQGRSLGRGWLLLPLILTAAVYLFTTTNRGVIDYDEGYYAQAAKEMAVTGNWVTPYVNGVRFLEKPPFLYWITAVSFKLFGINEFALRLPTAFAVLCLVWIVMLIARRLVGEQAALISGLSASFSAGAYIFTRETLHDIWLVLFVALAMYAFIVWYLDPQKTRCPALLFYAAVAGACMCKSLIGVAFPIGIIIAFFFLSREKPQWRTMHLMSGTLLFLILTVPWHWLAAVQNQGFLKFFFVGEQFLRFLGKREPAVLWSLPLLTFWLLLLVWLFPWTAFLPAAVVWGRKSSEKNQRTLVNLVLAWAGVILGFFSISNRLEHYVFPALPAFSLLVAGVLAKGESKWVLWAFRGLAILGILVLMLGVGVSVWLVFGHGLQYSTGGPADRLSENDFSILAEMPSVVVSNLLKPAALTALALAIGFYAALRFEMRHRRMQAVICVAAAMMVLCGATHWSLFICEDLISSKKFGLAIAKEYRPGDRLIVLDDYESANSLAFYQPLRVEVCEGLAYALIPGMKFPDAPRIVLTLEEFDRAWLSPGRVFALGPKSRMSEVKPDGVKVMQILDRVLIQNH